MNDSDHTFSMPETERHKLDEVKEQIADVKEEIANPVARRLGRQFQRDPWPLMSLAAAGGILCGLMLRRRG